MCLDRRDIVRQSHSVSNRCPTTGWDELLQPLAIRLFAFEKHDFLLRAHRQYVPLWESVVAVVFKIFHLIKLGSHQHSRLLLMDK